MVTVPVAMPVTVPTPVTEAVSGAELLHKPPGVASLRDIVEPTHTVEGPAIAAGAGPTVMVMVLVHPEPSE